MNNCNGRASYSTSYDPTPMRQPGTKSKVPSTKLALNSQLSAEAQEFVPSFRKPPNGPNFDSSGMSANLGPPIPPQQFIQQSGHHHPQNHHQAQQNLVRPFPLADFNHPLGSGGLDRLNGQNINQSHHHSHHHPHHHQQHPHHHHHSQHHNMNHHGGPNNNRQNNSSYSVQNRLNQFNGTISGGRAQQSHQQHQGHYHQQQQQQNHLRGVPNGGQSPNMQQAQQQLQQMQISSADNEGQNPEPTEAEIHALSFLVEVMGKLNSNPGKFEDYQKELTTLYIEFSENHHVICNAIELIFTQSIDEQNFRYTGARLCRLLDSIDPSSDSKFRQLLCCKLQYNDLEIVQYIANEAHKVRNTTLFLAELYIQLQNDGSRITSIAHSIHHCINLLMPKLSPENIKCVCQTLKLCGYELDIDYPKETESLMSQLTKCENTDVSTQRLLTSVIELRKNRWGRSESIALTTQPVPAEDLSGQEFSNDPVFYGPDGEILTDEESAFLWNATAYPPDGYDDEEDNDPDALVEIEPEMDLEIQLAFKDFVTYQNNK